MPDKQHPPQAATPEEGVSTYVTLEGMRFHSVSWGPPDAPVLLCLHGLRSYARTFQPLAAALSSEFRVIALDQRGRGKTDWDPHRDYHAVRYAKDIGAFLDALNLRAVHLLGHSMGGNNALLYSLENAQRLRSLILEDSGPGASRNSEGATRINHELSQTPTVFADWDSARRFWRSIRPNVTEEAIDSRVSNSMHQTPEGIGWVHDQAGITQCRLHPSQPDPDLWPCIKKISCPTLLLRGARSDYLARTTFEQMLDTNPLIEGVEIEGAGHYLHDDQPQRFNEAVADFLRRQPR